MYEFTSFTCLRLLICKNAESGTDGKLMTLLLISSVSSAVKYILITNAQDILQLKS